MSRESGVDPKATSGLDLQIGAYRESMGRGECNVVRVMTFAHAQAE